ncbi:HEAT repeat protein [Kribbella sp. VKM Ac-2527]|uniref:HEAT repeat protein n=1 Tax=Kribbella caucasensis TaxID=2512215 RepID=A0A4R6KAT6_9ACTN|nr:HEAT repeat domain-containing protein [Kribbella sp. VKM Ac-2527]TDO45303.1 HEAT repeat protein [Kribbella sp. VKM Ac-2527]
MAEDGREHPRELIRAACAEYGEDAVIDWCVELLSGAVSPEDAFAPPLVEKLKWVAGPLVGGWAKLDPVNFYWVRVWAARAFLYVWRDDVLDVLRVAADDPAWRVREHVARITAQRELGQLVDALIPMLDHELPRVRASAVRAVGVAGEFEHAEAIEGLRDDPDQAVRAAVERALEKLEVRLDRSLDD